MKRQTDIKLNVFEPESLLNTVMQCTQSAGNARMHNFIILSPFQLSCLIAACALQLDYAHLIPTLTMHRSLPLNCLFDTQLQIILLNSQEHDSNDAARELIGSLFNKLSTPLALLVHPCGTELSVEQASWSTKLSLSKRTNGADALSLVKCSSLKTLSNSVSRSAGSSF